MTSCVSSHELLLYISCFLQLKLIPVNETRLQHLTTQLKWRLKEGFGDAIYEVGVNDNGKVIGLSEEDMSISLKTMEGMAKRFIINP